MFILVTMHPDKVTKKGNTLLVDDVGTIIGQFHNGQPVETALKGKNVAETLSSPAYLNWFRQQQAVRRLQNK